MQFFKCNDHIAGCILKYNDQFAGENVKFNGQIRGCILKCNSQIAGYILTYNELIPGYILKCKSQVAGYTNTNVGGGEKDVDAFDAHPVQTYPAFPETPPASGSASPGTKP